MHAFAIGGEFTTSGEEVELTTGQIQVYVPFPTGPYTALFNLDTSAMPQWGDFCELMAAVLKTVGFPAEDAEA